MFRYQTGLQGLNSFNPQAYYIQPSSGALGAGAELGSPGYDLEGFGATLTEGVKKAMQGEMPSLKSQEGDSADDNDFWNILKTVIMSALAGG